MKILVIHPTDSSTDFLSKCYDGLNCTLVRDINISSNKILRLIREHDRIICLGHGTGEGLIRPSGGFILSSKHVEELRKDRDLIFIWCNANSFMEKYNLKGFGTGMIISEKNETDYCNIEGSDIDVENANLELVSALKTCIACDSRALYENVVVSFNWTLNAITLFNSNNFYYF